jgi:general secretion pathway protein D
MRVDPHVLTEDRKQLQNVRSDAVECRQLLRAGRGMEKGAMSRGFRQSLRRWRLPIHWAIRPDPPRPKLSGRRSALSFLAFQRLAWPALFTAICLLAGSCAQRMEGAAVAANGTAEVESAAPSRSAPTILNQQSPDEQNPAPKPVTPEIFPGTGVLVGSPAPRSPTANVTAGAEGISFNFVNADVREVVRDILGGQLHLNYVVDPKVRATITVQTGGPLSREAVLPTLQNVLQANGVAMVQSGDVYRILPVEDAAKAALPTAGVAGSSSYGMRILPLRYASATELKSVLDPFVPPGSVLQIDAARNLLIVTGSGVDLAGFTDLVRQFDVDWMAGTSFAIYPLQVGTAKDIASELDSVFGEGGSGPLAGVVRIVPIDRLNAILVISPQSAYLARVKAWIDRLDYGDDQTTPRLFQYRVQNSRASDLAAVLTQLFSSSEVKTVQAEVAPGSKLAVQVAQQSTMGATRPGSSIGVGGGTTSGVAGTGYALPTGAFGAEGQPVNAGRQTDATGRTTQTSLQTPQAGTTVPPSDIGLPSVRIVADEKNNALVIFARPRDYRMMEETIKRLDVVPQQVLIEATIAEVTLNDNLRYGLQWFFTHGGSKFQLTTATSGVGTSADINPSFPGFNYILGGDKTKVVLSALAELTHVNVVSSPQILVLDHQTAALQVGDQVPIIAQSAQSVITPGAPIVNSIQYLNTGVILQVTPRVNATGQVTLDIDQAVSDVAKTTTSTIDSPTITQRRIVTSVVVQDNQTVALGGLILDNHTAGHSGVPVLSDIPIFGALFSTTTNNSGRTELLVLLTPRVVRSASEARAMTDELRDRMQAVKPLVVRQP